MCTAGSAACCSAPENLKKKNQRDGKLVYRIVSIQEREADGEEGGQRGGTQQLSVRVERRERHRALAQMRHTLRNTHQHQRDLQLIKVIK